LTELRKSRRSAASWAISCPGWAEAMLAARAKLARTFLIEGILVVVGEERSCRWFMSSLNGLDEDRDRLFPGVVCFYVSSFANIVLWFSVVDEIPHAV
jgi:hypothetical protein